MQIPVCGKLTRQFDPDTQFILTLPPNSSDYDDDDSFKYFRAEVSTDQP